jgi:N-acetylglucosaminyl-diphospho-decaprenol L-rhamnosyltransferase
VTFPTQPQSKPINRRESVPASLRTITEGPEEASTAAAEASHVSSGPFTTAVIVHWGSLDPTVRLVRKLIQRIGIDEVIVVANDLLARPPELTDSAIWIVPPRNLGFAGGFDYGSKYSRGADCYLLLNNDVDIDDKCIAECHEVLADPTIGIVAPILVNSTGVNQGELQAAVGRMSHPLFKGTTMNYPSAGRVCDADWVTGAVMFIRADCYEQVGFNLGYFLGWEDADLCFRARNKGWRVAIASRAQAWHRGGATIPTVGSAYYFMRNRIWFSRQWGTPLQACLVWLWIATVLTPKILLGEAINGGGTKRTLSSLHALVDGLKRIPSDGTVSIEEPYPARWSQWG